MDTRPAGKGRASRYLVRSEGGELRYDTLLHLEQAYLTGMVSPDDEVSVEGSGVWKRVSELPQLANVKHVESRMRGGYWPQVVGSVALSVAALVFLVRATTSENPLTDWMITLVLVIVLSALLFRLTYKASRPKRR